MDLRNRLPDPQPMRETRRIAMRRELEALASRPSKRWRWAPRSTAAIGVVLVLTGGAAIGGAYAAHIGSQHSSTLPPSGMDVAGAPPAGSRAAAELPKTNAGVNQRLLQECLESQATHPTGNCTGQVPGLAQCEAAALQCNTAAMRERISDFPPAQKPKPGAKTISTSTALSEAKQVPTTSGRTAAAERAPAVARLMTYSAANKLLGQGADPLISPTRPVWIVSVHATVANPDAPSGTIVGVHSNYTVMIDAYSGSEILIGYGADAVGPWGEDTRLGP